MPVYEISKFAGGVSDFEDRGIVGAFKFGANLDIRKKVDSLSCLQALIDEGLDSNASPSASVSPSASPSSSASASQSPSASPSSSPSPSTGTSSSPSQTQSASPSSSPSTTPSSSISSSPSPSSGLSTVFHDLIRWFVKATNGYTYGFGNTGIIYRRDSDGFWNREYKDPNGTIKGAWEWYADNGKTYLYWATDTRLNRKELPGRSDWNDVNADAGWPKINLTSADWHTMRDAGGALIIANGSNLALVGYDQSYTNDALNLIPGNLSKTIVERNGRTIVGTAKASDPNRSINAAIDTEVQLAQVGDDGEVFFANMSDSVPVFRFPGGGKVNPGGVCNEIDQVNFFEWEQDALSWIDKQSVGNMALFAVYDADTGKGGVYSYGRKNKNHSMVLNLDHQLDADELGAIVNVDGTTLVSYRNGTEFGVKATNPNAKATATYEGLDFRSPVKKPVNVTVWNYAEVYCQPLPEDASIEFWYKVNKNGDFIQAKMEDGAVRFTANGEKKAVFLIAAEGDIFEPRVVLNPHNNNDPEVNRIRIYFN
jgi:hypothetical protein